MGVLASVLAALLWPSAVQAAAPIVDGFTASSASVPPGGTAGLRVAAHDPDCAGTCSSGCGQTIRSDLTQWTASAGSFTAKSNGVTGSPYAATADWQAPSAEGTYTVRVTMADSGTFMCGGRNTVTAELTILVTTSTNKPPVIDSLSAAPAQLYPGQTSQLTCRASDPDGDPLSYAWSADAGSIAAGAGNTATWTAGAPGIATVTCTVADTGGASASSHLRLSVTDAVPESSLSSGLESPQRVAADSLGNLYVVDRSSGGLTVVNLFDGAVVYRLPVRDATSVAVDWQDRLLTGGSSGARLLDRRGAVVLRLDPGEALGPVADVAVDASQRRYAVLHHATGRVVVYDASGSKLLAFGSTGDEAGQLRRPQGIAVTPGGGLVVADSGHGQIKLFGPAGDFLSAFAGFGGGAGQFVQLDDVAVDDRGIIYASDTFQSWVQSFDPDGTLREVVGTFGDRVGQFKTPTGLAPVASFHKLVVASLNASSLQVFRMNGDTPQQRLPQPSLSSVALAFPAQAVGTASEPRSFTLGNLGNASLGLRRLAVNGDYGQTNDCGSFLDPGQTCTLSVTFEPANPGASTGSLTLETSAGPDPLAVSLSGEAFAHATASLTPAQLAFPDQAVATVGAPQTAVLTNTGSVPLAVFEVRASTGFGLSHGCGATLLAGTSCLIDVRFTPTSPGLVTGTLTVVSNAVSGPLVVSLSGRALERRLAVSPEALDFGRRPVGKASPPKTVTVTNTGPEPVDVQRVELGGDRPDAFLLERDGCTRTRLAAGQACEIAAGFRPPEPGDFLAWGRVTSNAAGSPHQVSLQGFAGKPGPGLIFKDGFESGDLSAWSTVVPPPAIVVRLLPGAEAAARAGFGDQAVGVASAPRTVAVLNAGEEPVEIGLLSLEGDRPDLFRLGEDGCSGLRLPAGSACLLRVVFVPGEPGSWTAALEIPSSFGRGVVEMAGAGVRLEEQK